MKSLYANYNPKDNTMSLVVQIENKIIELEAAVDKYSQKLDVLSQ